MRSGTWRKRSIRGICLTATEYGNERELREHEESKKPEVGTFGMTLQTKKSLRDYLQLGALIYLSVWVSAPILAYGELYRLMAVLSVLLWSAVEITRHNNIFVKPTLYILVLYMFLLYTVPVIAMTDGVGLFKRNIQFYIMLFFLFVYASYARRDAIADLKPVVYLNIILFTVWSYTTYRGLLIDPHASRYVIKSNEEARQLTKMGVGGFAFIYSLLIYILGIMALLKKEKIKKGLWHPFSLFMIFSALFAGLVVLKAGYSLAVLLMLLSVVFYAFYSKNIIKNIILFLGMILIYIVIEHYMLDILYYLYNHVQEGAYRLKIRDAILSYSGNEVVGTVADRVERYLRSLNIFLDHPLLGNWNFAAIGKHSMVLDTFAQFGLFAGIALLYIVLKVPYDLYRRARSEKIFSLTVLLLIAALISVNNVSMLYGFMFYIFYPYIYYRLERSGSVEGFK